MTQQPLLRIRSLSRNYGGLAAVSDLSFHVAPGEIVGLLGPNGAGKTTTIRCIASLLAPTSGHIEIDGHDIESDAIAARRATAYVPEIPSVYELLTVMEHLRFVSAAYGMSSEMARAPEILKRLDLWEKRFAVGASLSKGMKQKLACACAFMHRARLFCLDEPLIGLDPAGARALKQMLQEERAAGSGVLISTHMLDTAERLCDRVVILSGGRAVADGTLQELRERQQAGGATTLEELFFTITEEAVCAR